MHQSPDCPHCRQSPESTCPACHRRSLIHRLGFRGGIVAASLFGLSATPLPAFSQPAIDANTIAQSDAPQPLYGVVPEPRMEERTLEGTIAGINELDDDDSHLEIEIANVGQKDGAQTGNSVHLPELDITTRITRCEDARCFANVAATRYELEENPDVEVTVWVPVD